MVGIDAKLLNPVYQQFFLDAHCYPRYHASIWHRSHSAIAVRREMYDRLVDQTKHFRSKMDWILHHGYDDLLLGQCDAEAKANDKYMEFVQQYWKEQIESIRSVNARLQRPTMAWTLAVTIRD